MSSKIPNDNYNQIKTLDDLALTNISRNDFPVVEKWRDDLFSSNDMLPRICDELPWLLTEYMSQSEGNGDSLYTQRAKALNHVFSNKKPIVKTTDLLPGQTTTANVGAVVYVDAIGYCIWPELNTVSKRAKNPYNISPEVINRLNQVIFPYWLNRRAVQEVARYTDYNTKDYPNRDKVNGTLSIDPDLQKKAGETPKCQELMERITFYLSDKATCVSHTVPDFNRLLKYGINGLLDQIKKDIKNANSEQKEFLEGVQVVFEGALIYAKNLANESKKIGHLDLEKICTKVPAEPPETLHEAIVSIWICYHLLLQENTNFGFSIGRVDQLLNSYYISDWLKITDKTEKTAYTKKAVELICHFFLHCSDHVPLSTEGAEVLFAGSGSNQALTVGGTNYVNGKVVDAVNDMTYIILKATEILAIRDPNVHTRYHKTIHNVDGQGNPLSNGGISAYLKRICQVNIITKATPAIHGDVPVVKAMADYYSAQKGISKEEALQDAYDYSSIGCIEQNSSGKHYGNTGSTLFVLPAVLELTLYGGKHRSMGVGEDDQNLFSKTTSYTSPPLLKMNNMNEFIDAFKYQLNEMAKQAVQNNNYLGRAMEKVRPSPFLSGLFTGPTNVPGDNQASFSDLSSGGAKYNSSGIAVIGLADVIDSFCVIHSLVFGNKVSASELLASIDADFKVSNDNKISAQRLDEIKKAIKLAPKYGAGVKMEGSYDNALAVNYTHLLTKIIHDTFYQYRSHRGGRYLVGYWSMTNHAGFGMLTKATPNGRQSGKAFASGITPCSDIVKKNGDPVNILDHILSVAKVNPNNVQNGYTYNLSLTTRDASYFEKDTELFSNYIKTFIDENGVLVQLCVNSIKDFKDAHEKATRAADENASDKDKENLLPYKDLMIRVAGYSAYFVTLSPQMRQEIIDRSNFALETGKEQHSV